MATPPPPKKGLPGTLFHRMWHASVWDTNVAQNKNIQRDYPVSKIPRTNVQCLRHWPNIKPAYIQHLWSCWRIPANTTRWANIVLKLVHRLRRWHNIKTTLAQWLVFAGIGQYHFDKYHISRGFCNCIDTKCHVFCDYIDYHSLPPDA